MTYLTANSALVHAAGSTVTVGAGAALRNVAVISADLPAVPTTAQQGSALVKGFAGTGITIAGAGCAGERPEGVRHRIER